MQRATLIAALLLVSLARNVNGQTTPHVKSSTSTIPPSVISTIEPIYPPNAPDRFRGAVVVAKLVVATDGSVHDAKVVKGLGFGLDEAALEAVKRWRFHPAMKDGMPVSCNVTVEIAFPPRDLEMKHVNGEKVFDLTKGIRPPKPIGECNPDFSPLGASSKKPKVKGQVLLEVVVGSDGNVVHIRVVQGLGTEINQAVTNAVGNCRFEPAVREKDGMPVAVHVPMNFNLNLD